MKLELASKYKPQYQEKYWKYHPFSDIDHIDPQTLWAFAIALAYLPELDNKTLLLKTPHI